MGESRKDLDELDIQLVNLLYTDSRMKYSEIADKLNVSVGSVHNRIKSLEERGVIKKFTVQLNPEKIDRDLTVVIEMQIEVSHLNEVNDQLQCFPDIIALYNVTGNTDILAIARFKDRRHMNDTLQKILQIRHITRTATHLALQILKEEWLSPTTTFNNKSKETEPENYNSLDNSNLNNELEVEK